MASRPRAWVVAAALLGGCLEYSPHQLPTDESERDLNRKAVERIVSRPVERLRFVVVGDTQRGFSEAEDAVDAINRRDDVQFVVQLGDFTNVGVWLEFRLMNDIFARLRVPYLVVVGFHDLLGNGEAIYRAMFGPTDFAFTHGRVRLVAFDSNSSLHDYDGTVPDVAWLAEQLAPSAEHDRALTFSHVAPGQGADFDPALTAPTIAVLAGGGVDLSLHSHAHRYEAYVRDGVRFVLADSVEHRSFVVVSQREDGGFDQEKVDF
jgi:3',5'-cyclic AMP phosphodiesterase CpdA